MKALVTGATGFLGGALARRLYAEGWRVTAVGRNRVALARIAARGIDTHLVDLRNATGMRDACRGQDVVFHCGAAVGSWGDYQEYYAINVEGTRNVVNGCKHHNVGRLVHVSTPSIYFTTETRLNVKEDDLLPVEQVNVYSATKLLAEGVIDQAHGEGLPIITIRPRAIFGPGDQTIFPRVLKAIQRGRMRILGDGKNVQDLTYIDNAVDALLLCACAPDRALGKKFNISNGDAVEFWSLLRHLCQELGYEPPSRHMSTEVALTVATMLERLYKLLHIQREPPITRYTVAILARSMTLDLSAAKRDLGYAPRVSIEDGVRRFVEWWKESISR